MSDMINSAVAALSEKLGSGFDGSAKFVIEDEGAIMLDGDGVRAGDEEADVTLTAHTDPLRAILAGDLKPTAAFMSGRLPVSADTGMPRNRGVVLA